MEMRQQDVERIVVEVLRQLQTDRPSDAGATYVSASCQDNGDLGLFDRLEDAIAAAEVAQKKLSLIHISEPTRR